MSKKQRKKKTNKPIIWQNPTYRWGMGLFLVIALLFIFLSGPRGTIRYFKARQQKEQLQQDIKQLQAQKTHLDSLRIRLKNDPDYIEKLAREEYNMKKKGEKVYKIVRESK